MSRHRQERIQGTDADADSPTSSTTAAFTSIPAEADATIPIVRISFDAFKGSSGIQQVGKVNEGQSAVLDDLDPIQWTVVRHFSTQRRLAQPGKVNVAQEEAASDALA